MDNNGWQEAVGVQQYQAANKRNYVSIALALGPEMILHFIIPALSSFQS